jgi:glutamate:GABA antiporter
MSARSEPLPGAGGLRLPARARTTTSTAGAATATKSKAMSVGTMAIMTAATVVTSLRGLPMMAQEELTMFGYIAFAVLLFLIPAALVSAELGGAFAGREGGVYTWVGEAFGQRFGFLAVWLQWIQNVVWYPTGLAFAAAAVAFIWDDADLAGKNVYVGLFCIVSYWVATFVALSGTDLLVKVTKFGFVLGTIVPGVILLGLFGWWVVKGYDLGWDTTDNSAVTVVTDGHAHPRWFPNYTGLGTLSFLAGILLLFAGVEVQAVHQNEMKDSKTGFPKAMILAAIISAAIFTIGALAVSGILPYNSINLQTGVFDTLWRVLDETGGGSVIMPILAALIGYGALGGALAWIGGPSKGLLKTAKDGCLPPVMQQTNSKGIQRNILILQGIIVTLISSIYLIMDDVSSAFFLISAMTISLYIVMYLMLYAAAIKLRYQRPDLPRTFKIPGGKAGLWAVCGIGFAAVAFALVLSFVPPDQLPIGNSTTYILIVAAGLIVFTGLPMLIQAMRKPEWAANADGDTPAPATTA